MTTAPAGQGEAHIYRFSGSTPDGVELQAGSCYIGIDAASWFVNRDSSRFKHRMASGTLTVTMSAGLESYQAALGTFDLDDGAKTAPIFDRPVLPDRAYLGGPITLGAYLTGIKKDTILAKLLKSAAHASLGIISGMVESAGTAGPIKVLSEAGDSLIKGVQETLTDGADGQESYFDNRSGLELTIRPSDILDSVTYLLFHRGERLDGRLEVKKVGETSVPTAAGLSVRDGAWILLRIRRSTVYSGVRPWQEDVKNLRADIQSLIRKVKFGELTSAEALKQFKSSRGGNNIYDKFEQISALISHDGVLIEDQAVSWINDMHLLMSTARNEIQKGADAAPDFGKTMQNMRTEVIEGNRPDVATKFAKDAVKLKRTRDASFSREQLSLLARDSGSSSVESVVSKYARNIHTII